MTHPEYSEGSAQAFLEVGQAMQAGVDRCRLMRTLLDATITACRLGYHPALLALLRAAAELAAREGGPGSEPWTGAAKEAADCVRALDVASSPVSRVWRTDFPEMWQGDDDHHETSHQLLLRLKGGTICLGRMVTDWEGYSVEFARIGEHSFWQVSGSSDELDLEDVACWMPIPRSDAVLQEPVKETA